MNNDRLNNDMFGKRPNYVKQVIIAGLIVLLLIAFFAVKGAGAASINDYPNPYYLVCNDPLLTNVTLVLSDCGNGSAERGKDTEDMPAVVPTATPLVVETVPVIETTPPVETEDNTPPADVPADGNPGNNKPVGNAGEKCNMGGFCEQGEQGNRGRGN